VSGTLRVGPLGTRVHGLVYLVLQPTNTAIPGSDCILQPTCTSVSPERKPPNAPRRSIRPVHRIPNDSGRPVSEDPGSAYQRPNQQTRGQHRQGQARRSGCRVTPVHSWQVPANTNKSQLQLELVTTAVLNPQFIRGRIGRDCPLTVCSFTDAMLQKKYWPHPTAESVLPGGATLQSDERNWQRL
jgi:hypothetical protein